MPLGPALIDFHFSAFNFIFKTQENTVSVLAAHFPYIKDDLKNFLFIILQWVIPFTALLKKKKTYKLSPHLIAKHIPAHWNKTPCALCKQYWPRFTSTVAKLCIFKQANSLASHLLLFCFFSSRWYGKYKAHCKYLFWYVLGNILHNKIAWIGECLHLKIYVF